MLLTLENISKSFGDKQVLSDVNVTVEDDDKIGVIGENGAGKTTLIQIICGLLPADEGRISLVRNKNIGFLQQNSGLISENTIEEEMRRAFAPLLKTEEKMQKLSQQMSVATGDDLEKITKEYARLSTNFEQQGGYQMDV